MSAGLPGRYWLEDSRKGYSRVRVYSFEENEPILAEIAAYIRDWKARAYYAYLPSRYEWSGINARGWKLEDGRRVVLSEPELEEALSRSNR